MWQEHLDAYDVPGRVVSYTQAHRDLPDMRAYQLVICDESHTLRSDKRRDYVAIKDYIENAGSKVLLLTATPYNIRFTDVANQLGSTSTTTTISDCSRFRRCFSTPPGSRSRSTSRRTRCWPSAGRNRRTTGSG